MEFDSRYRVWFWACWLPLLAIGPVVYSWLYPEMFRSGTLGFVAGLVPAWALAVVLAKFASRRAWPHAAEVALRYGLFAAFWLYCFGVEYYGVPVLNPYRGVELAADLNWHGFDQISNGMSEEEVLALIGEPLESNPDYGANGIGEVVWEYSRRGNDRDYSVALWVEVYFWQGVVSDKAWWWLFD